MIGRRLFWRIYLTLLASLAVSAVLIGLLWHFSGDRRVEGLRHFPLQLLEAAIPLEDDPPGAIQDAVVRIAHAVSGDITLVSANGRLLAVSGERLHRGPAHDEDEWDSAGEDGDGAAGDTGEARLSRQQQEEGQQQEQLLQASAGHAEQAHGTGGHCSVAKLWSRKEEGRYTERAGWREDWQIGRGYGCCCR